MSRHLDELRMARLTSATGFIVGCRSFFAGLSDPQIAGTADRPGRRLRRIVGIAAHIKIDDEQTVEFVLIETGERQVESSFAQITKFKPQ